MLSISDADWSPSHATPLLSWRWWKSASSAFSTAGARTWQQCTWSSKTGPSATTHTKREPSSTSCWDRSCRSSPGTGKTNDSRFVKGSFIKSWKQQLMVKMMMMMIIILLIIIIKIRRQRRGNWKTLVSKKTLAPFKRIVRFTQLKLWDTCWLHEVKGFALLDSKF